MSRDAEVRIVEMEAVRLQPDEVLVIRCPSHGGEEWWTDMIDLLHARLETLGVADRTVVLLGEWDLRVVKKDEADAS